MDMLLRFAWVVMTVLRFAGVFVIFGGVALFGVYFISGNARAARTPGGTIPVSSWRGAGPRKGLRIIALGIALLLGAFLIKLMMPNGA